MTADDRRSPDFHEYLAGTTEIWDRLAEWWDDAIGDGNDTQDLLIEPTTERLLNLRRGERVLDVACGAGRMARRMADAGAHVVAVDGAERFLARARSRSTGYGDRIEYRNVDASDREALIELGEGAFDAVVCTMALMDMAAITPLTSAVPVLLKAHGRFVFSVTHPVFNSGDARLMVERIEEGTSVRERYAVSVADYLDARMQPGFGIPGQPEQQRYFHRPIGMLLNACFEHGMVLDAFEEPAFPEPDNQAVAGRSPVSQRSFRHVPWVLVARLRAAARAR